jgi:hypothetical protein
MSSFRLLDRISEPDRRRHLRRARDWPWSAHVALAGLAEPPGFLDVNAAYKLLGADDTQARVNYLQLVSITNTGLLAELARPDTDAWLLGAVDDFSIPIAELARFLKIGLSTAYRRVAIARENEGSGPSFSVGNEGPGP